MDYWLQIVVQNQDWPSIITSLGGVITVLIAGYIAVQQNRVKQIATDTKQIAVITERNTNNTLSDLNNKLAQYIARQEQMVTALGEHPDAALIFKDIIKPIELANPPPDLVPIVPPLDPNEKPVKNG